MTIMILITVIIVTIITMLLLPVPTVDIREMRTRPQALGAGPNKTEQQHG